MSNQASQIAQAIASYESALSQVETEKARLKSATQELENRARRFKWLEANALFKSNPSRFEFQDGSTYFLTGKEKI